MDGNASGLYFQEKITNTWTFIRDKSISIHNHLLTYEPKSEFNDKINEHIMNFINKIPNEMLTNFINLLYGTKLTPKQVENKVTQLREEMFGKPTEDASRLLTKLIKLQQGGKCNLEYPLDDGGTMSVLYSLSLPLF